MAIEAGSLVRTIDTSGGLIDTFNVERHPLTILHKQKRPEMVAQERKQWGLRSHACWRCTWTEDGTDREDWFSETSLVELAT